MTLLIVVLVFGGMIFLHELGHYLAARLFKIEVEEFGFGIPPRLWRFWRMKGSLTISGQRIQIPSNFDLPFDGPEALQQSVQATADSVNGRLVLRTIDLLKPQEVAQTDFTWDSGSPERLVAAQLEALPGRKAPLKPAAPARRGELEVKGVLTELAQGTEWTLNWLPLGGFVRPKGEGDPEVPGGLAAANPWQRLGVLFAGPLMNLLTAVVVTAVIIVQMGVAVPGQVLIENVSPASPAEQAGILGGDVIVTINGQTVTTMEAARALIRASLDQPLEMVLLRGAEQVSLVATPLSSRSPEQGALGIGLAYPRRAATLSDAIGGGLAYTGAQAIGILYIPFGLIQGAIAPEEARLVGLKGIYDFFGQAVERDTESRQPAIDPGPGSAPTTSEQPTNYVLSLIAMLSVSLAVMNLLPIPALDGGRILFTLPEIIFRRRIPPRLENVINGVAMMMLIALMLFINVLDFIKPANITLP